MRFGQGLAFVFGESGIFLRNAWWLAILAGLPFSLSEMVRWGDPAPELGPYFAAHVVTALLDTYLFLVVIRFVAGRMRLDLAMCVDAGTVRRFAPFAIVTIILVATQYYIYLIDQSESTYWLVTAASVVVSALLAPWAVASGLGMANYGPRRSIRMAAPHLGWSLGIYAVLVALENVGFFLVERVVLPVPDVQLAGMTFSDVGYGMQSLALTSMLLVANQMATIAIARRTGLVAPVEDQVLRETFS